MSKKKVIKVILLVLSALLTAAQSTEGTEEPAKFSDDPDIYTE